MTLISKTIEDKKIIWFQNSNSYLVLEAVVANLIEKINNKVLASEIEEWIINTLDIPKNIAKEFIFNVNDLYIQNNKKHSISKTTNTFKLSTLFYSEKYYSINNFNFFIQFENDYLESQIHPTFAHLETTSTSNVDFHYQIFEEDDFIVFLKNKSIIGSWTKNEAHVFQGKLSMQILIDIYKKPETDWMGVFHASAISNGKESMLFLGDSGNGKSTSLALLNANGFNCIADDFVPIDSEKNIRTYPAAISIKKKSVATLLPYYPELKNSAEYHFKKLNKIVRFLPPNKIDYNEKLKCKALVFIKYNPNIELEINSMSQVDAFQQLVPDSWISPIKGNTTTFLDWFLDLPCYQLTYSNNQKMIDTVSKIFNDEL